MYKELCQSKFKNSAYHVINNMFQALKPQCFVLHLFVGKKTNKLKNEKFLHNLKSLPQIMFSLVY